MAKKRTLESRMAYRIKRSPRTVFMRRDFEDLGGYDQVGRVLRRLVQKELLMHIGYGLYARTTTSVLNGTIIPEKPLPWLAKEALNRLGIEVTPTQADLDQASGKSTQVPTGRSIGVKGRVSRKIGYFGMCVYYEQST